MSTDEKHGAGKYILRLLRLATSQRNELTALWLPWVPEIFSRVWQGASSAGGRHVFNLRPKTRAATCPKPETAHKKSLAPRVHCGDKQWESWRATVVYDNFIWLIRAFGGTWKLPIDMSNARQTEADFLNCWAKIFRQVVSIRGKTVRDTNW